MLTEFQQNIGCIAGKTAYEKGARAFREGAVLDIGQNGKVIEARVANAIGRFERVQLRIAKGILKTHCSCPWKISAFCEHAVAAILQWHANDGTTMEKALKTTVDNASPTAPITSTKMARREGRQRSRRGSKSHSLRNFLTQAAAIARLEVHIDGPSPSLDSRWSKLELRVDLIHDSRKFSASNIKRLVEVGSGAGGMRLEDFALQEQQLMRFLLTHAETVGTRYVLGAHDAADLFHGMSRFQGLFCGNGRLSVHSEPIELVFHAAQETKHFRITPRFALPDHGLLPTGQLNIIIGRGGAWLGIGTDYWWLPGITDNAWLRTLIKGGGVSLTTDEVERLSNACERRRLPARVLPATQATDLRAVVGECIPIVTLDWISSGIVARVEFEYSGQRIAVDGPEILWHKNKFVSRDSSVEDQALKTMKQIGFVRYPGKTDMFALRDPEKLWDFLDNGLENITDNWHIYYSNKFNKIRKSSGQLNLKAKTVEESDSWFDIDCELETETGELINVDDVIKAIKKNDAFIKLPSGAVATLPAALRNSLEIMIDRAKSRDHNRIRFSKYAAVPVDMALAEYQVDNRASWQALCQRLQEPAAADHDLEVPAELRSIMRDYQRDGVAWITTLEECGFHGILADEMGLGKTVQALAVLSRRKKVQKDGKPSIVVCPTSLVENWHMEANRFSPELKTAIIEGPQRQRTINNLKDVDLAITSYALLRRDIEMYEEKQFDYLILDEAQHIKNPETVNAKTCKTVNADHRLILTGTPIENALHEVWSLFDFLLPGMLGSRSQFRNRYELPAANGDGHETNAELATQIRPFILRRTKAEVCSQLPPKIEQIVYCELQGQQRQLYADLIAAGREMLAQARKDGWNKSRFEMLAFLMRLRQACCHPPLLPPDLRPVADDEMPSAKMELLREIILQAIDSERRMLLFSQFTGLLKSVQPWLREQGIAFEYLDGATKNRMDRVKRFNESPDIPIFLISLKAGGTGLNLTGADTVIHYDQWWNPMVEDQATDRTHRIGQTSTVTSMKLVARHTIEERILKLQDEKRDLFNQLLGGAPTKLGELKPEDFEFLLQQDED